MICKLAFKELKRNILINMLCLIQIAMIFVITAAMVTSVISRFNKYEPFKEYLNKKGVFLNVANMRYGEDIVVTSEDDIKNNLGLEKTDDVICLKNVWVQENLNVTAYTTDLINAYKPELQDGIWLSEGKGYADNTIDGIISDNNDNINTGDIIEITECFKGDKLKIRIIGKLSEESEIIGFSDSQNGKFSCDNLYTDYQFKERSIPLLILNSDDISKTNIPFTTQVNGSLIITYQDNITNDEIKSNKEKLFYKNGYAGYSELKDMNRNSKKIIYSEIIKLLPVIISIFILTMVSILISSAVNAKSRIKIYAIFFICGMQWKQIIKIEMLKSAFIILLSGFLSETILLMSDKKQLFGGLYLENGLYQSIFCIIISIMFILISACFPAIITNKQKPVTVFHS